MTNNTIKTILSIVAAYSHNFGLIAAAECCKSSGFVILFLKKKIPVLRMLIWSDAFNYGHPGSGPGSGPGFVSYEKRFWIE